jgi:methylthioribose-1-phosphate isomerase
MICTMEWKEDALRILDQTKLPLTECFLDLKTMEDVIEAIQSLRVRGAPAIGVTAAYGMVLAAKSIVTSDTATFIPQLRGMANNLISARPTAVNLEWAVECIMEDLQNHPEIPATDIPKRILEHARMIHEDDQQRCKAMAENGQELISDQSRILTHCNTGYLATSGMGTALGVLFAAHARGKVGMVYVDETRPLLQGARLTAWECTKAGMPHTLICDSMAAVLMQQGKVDGVIVGADRIASDGSVANKIGTYGLAVQANYHGIPFHVAAPLSTFDAQLSSGESIPIEGRDASEVHTVMGRLQIGPDETPCWNPAFDVTPPSLISNIITEAGIFNAPFDTQAILEAIEMDRLGKGIFD